MRNQLDEVPLEERQISENDFLISRSNAARLLLAVEDIKQRRNVQEQTLIDD